MLPQNTQLCKNALYISNNYTTHMKPEIKLINTHIQKSNTHISDFFREKLKTCETISILEIQMCAVKGLLDKNKFILTFPISLIFPLELQMRID